jgi:hypothetical protein
MMLSVTGVGYCRMIGWQWIVTWEGRGKEWSWPNLSDYADICIDGLRKNTVNFSEDSWILDEVQTQNLVNVSHHPYNLCKVSMYKKETYRFPWQEYIYEVEV